MAEEFEDNLPLDGKVRINWVDGEPEEAIYIGYLVGKSRRCAVKVTRNDKPTNIWVDRRLLTAIEEENKSENNS
jgi:hypothetical protein